MKSRDNNNRSGRFFWWLNHFWSLTVSTRLVLEPKVNGFFITTNAKGAMVNLQNKDQGVIILDGGGFLPKYACAFGVIDRGKTLQLLEKINADPIKETHLHVPMSISSYMGWQENDEIAGFKIRVISDTPWDFVQSEIGQIKFNICWLCRTVLALPVILGQMLLFLFPLLIFGFSSAAIVETMLLVCGLVLAVFWNMLPIHGMIKGLLFGLVLAAIFWFIPINFNNSKLYLLNFIICSGWMGLIFQGNTQ